MKGGKTLYGLKSDSEIKIKFNLKEYKVSEIQGSSCSIEEAEISESQMFSMPTFISLNGIPYYPTKYEILTDVDVSYSSSSMPNFNISLNYGDNPLRLRARVKRYTITKKGIEQFDVPKRPRKPNQNQVMGCSASDHVKELEAKGILVNKATEPVSWHWCHLIGFSMFETEKAQKKGNLVCGTAACNGHMTNIETAVKMFVRKYNRPLGLEVTAEYVMDTHVALRIRYRIFDKKGSLMSFSEYYDALTTVKTDTSDYESIYKRMIKEFGENE
jgi:hypothetical protein